MRNHRKKFKDHPRSASLSLGITTTEKPEERRFRLRKGKCSYCGEDSACRQFDNGTFVCICTHDGLPPTSKGTCPRITVSPSDPPKPITGIVMPAPPESSASLNSTLPSILRSAGSPMINALHVSIICSSIFLVVIIGVTIFLCIRRRKLSTYLAAPINLKHSLLLADRYAPNPQYSACSGTGVPVLRLEDLKFVKEIGEGCFGKVYKGTLTVNEDTEVVAIKVLKESASKEAEDDFLREVEIMSAFKHPNILRLLGVVLRDGTISLMMVFEFMPLGDLAELLRGQKKTYDEESVPQLSKQDLLLIAYEIASGMRYLAAQRFVHRDLACRNCLVAAGPIVKIADFGMSRDVYTCDYYKIGGSRLLPVRWMSPESVVYGRFTLESDIWSYGVVLWEIYSLGKQPYYGHTNEEVVKLILDNIMLIPPEDCPPLICDLMKNCWKTEPRHRITFSNICEKLEAALESFSKVSLSSEQEIKVKTVNNKSLPRPPPLPLLTTETDLLDPEGYLLPKILSAPVHYLETLPD